MKKNLLKAFVAFILIANAQNSRAQTIPNGGFETWAPSGTFNHPVYAPAPLFQSSNFETFYRYGLLNVTEIPGVPGSAMRIENIASATGDTLKGLAAWGNVNSGSMNNGIPLPGGQPLTGCNVTIRYSVNPVTPGFVAFIPTTAGAPSGAGNGIFPGAYVYQLTGSLSSFTNMNYTFSPGLTMNPDSCIVIVASADFINTDKGTIGDFVEVDNFAWTGTTNVFPGGNLDVWQPVPSVEIPAVWYVGFESPDFQTFNKSTDVASGNYSLLLKNIVTSPTDRRVGQAMMGYYDCPSGGGPCTMHPGMAISSTPKSMGFYYKYSTPGVDTASAYVNLTTGGMGTTGGWMAILPQASWTFASIMIPTPGSTPDSAFISFESGRWQTAVDGSTLQIDDVKFHYCGDPEMVQGPLSVCVNSSGVQYMINSEFASGYNWSTTTGTISGSSTGQSVTINNILAGGTVSVTKIYADGCPNATFNYTISVSPSSSANAGGNQTICTSDMQVDLTGVITGATGANWTTSGSGSFADPNDLTTSYTPTAADTSAGSVVLTLTPMGTGTCPVSNGQMTINFISSPNVSAGSDQDACYGTMTTLSGSGALSYTWDNGVMDGDPFNSPIGTVNYTVTGLGSNGCSNTDMVAVTIYQLPSVALDLSAIDTVCDNGGTVTLAGGMPLGGNYSGTGVSGGIFDPVAAGSGSHAITYTFSDVNSCQSSAVQMIYVDPCSMMSVEEQNEMISSIYPNPTSSVVNVKVKNNNQTYQISILDVTGRVIYSETSDKANVAIDLKEQAKGMYFIRLVSGNASSYKRITKE